MLGFSALSENPISSVNKVLELSASMTGLAVSSSAAAGTLVGAASLSSSSIQTSVGTRVQAGFGATLESTSVASAAGVFIRGTISDTDLISSFTQGSAGIRLRSGISTVSSNFTQTTTGELLFTEIDPSVTVTYTEITPSVTATYTEITHTGDTWTEIIP
jgi:hypothetical protein